MTVPGHNQEFRKAEVGWWYQGTVGAILDTSSAVDLRGFGGMR